MKGHLFKSEEYGKAMLPAVQMHDTGYKSLKSQMPQERKKIVVFSSDLEYWASGLHSGSITSFLCLLWSVATFPCKLHVFV